LSTWLCGPRRFGSCAWGNHTILEEEKRRSCLGKVDPHHLWSELLHTRPVGFLWPSDEPFEGPGLGRAGPGRLPLLPELQPPGAALSTSSGHAREPGLCLAPARALYPRANPGAPSAVVFKRHKAWRIYLFIPGPPSPDWLVWWPPTVLLHQEGACKGCLCHTCGSKMTNTFPWSYFPKDARDGPAFSARLGGSGPLGGPFS
jgi:hypothetical protein